MTGKYTKEDIVKTKCDFCGREIECPRNAINLKQCCFECFQKLPEKMDEIPVGKLHIDIPLNETDKMNEFVAGSITERIFPKIWKDEKDELKNMNRKDALQKVFAAGVLTALNYFHESMEEFEENNFNYDKEG